MAITAAEIEASGWVVRLTLTAAPGSFASYALDPNGSPRLTLTSSHAGFAKSGGQAVAQPFARNMIGTKPLRLPVNPASPTTPVIDETDLGGGSIRVRIALSEHVYATDTGVTLNVAAGWRMGEGAAAGIAVTNSSTCAAPIPIMRWALLPYSVTAGAFTVAMVVASHHPVGFEPVAGIKFTVTDGTTVKTVWTTALSTDNSYGDGLRCYTITIDPATATALTAGLLRIDAEIYPWLGAMRTTDPAGTRSMTTLRTDGWSVDAASPWVIGYDPAGTRYSQQWVFVDPVNGTDTASASMVATSLAGAKAVAPAARARTVNCASQAAYLANRTLAAANGQAAQTRSVDGLRIVLAAGTNATGTTSVTTGIAAAEIPMRIMGDPDDANPRANCIMPTSANAVSRVTRVRFEAMRLEIGVNSLSSFAFMQMDNVEVRGRAGSESSSTAAFTGSPAAGFYSLGLARTRWWKTASTMGGGNTRPGFVRACEHSRDVTAALFAAKNRLIPSAEDGFTGALVFNAFTGWPSASVAGQVEDVIIAHNDIRSLRGRAFSAPSLPAATAGTPNPSTRRFVAIGNVCERIGSDPQPFYSFGEDLSSTMSYNIIEGNTFAGDRCNSFYSDPLPTTIAETNTLLNQAFVNRMAGNAFDWLPTKHDDFNDPQTAGVRGTANGYRPHMVEAWSMLYGVCHEGNVDTRRDGTSLFPLEFSGPRSLAGYSGAIDPLYTDDNSIKGPDGTGATGGGNYLPQSGSPLLSRTTRGQSDADFAGTPRAGPAASGAFEPIITGLIVTTGLSAGANVPLGTLGNLAASGDIGTGSALSLGSARGLAVTASIAVQASVEIAPTIVGNPFSIRFASVVSLGSLGTAGLAAPLTARATLTARLRTGANLSAGLAARATITAYFSAASGLAAQLIAPAGLTAGLQTGILLTAAPAAQAGITARLRTGAGFFAGLAASSVATATLDTAYYTAADLAAAASVDATLTIGKHLGAHLVASAQIDARLYTRQRFPDEPAPNAGVPRAFARETLDALVWRVTGHSSIEAVLAANPGLADLGPFLPEGHAVDLDAATDSAAIAAAATRDLVQLWD